MHVRRRGIEWESIYLSIYTNTIVSFLQEKKKRRYLVMDDAGGLEKLSGEEINNTFLFRHACVHRYRPAKRGINSNTPSGLVNEVTEYNDTVSNFNFLFL
jgi:hypothetical protein